MPIIRKLKELFSGRRTLDPIVPSPVHPNSIPPVLHEITEDKESKLVDLLIESHQRIKKGEVYSIGGRLPKDLSRALVFDTGMILIGMVAAGMNQEVAERYLRSITLKAYKKMGISVLDTKPDDVDLTLQRILLKKKIEEENDGWAAYMSQTALSWVYDFDFSNVSAETSPSGYHFYVEAGTKAAEHLATLSINSESIVRC